MRELDPIRRLAPPVEPLAPEAVDRIRARALAPRRRRRRPPLAGLLAPVVAAAAAGVALVVVPGGGEDREVPAPAGQALHADGGEPPRLLLGGGWKVARVDQWKPDRGEMTFARDGRELRLTWGPTEELIAGIPPEGKVEGARPELEFGTAEGFRAEVWRGPADRYTATWADGDTTLVAQGEGESAAGFAGLVQSLREVGVEEWRRAVPATAVRPPERAGTVDEMLAGLPLPPGLDAEALRSSTATRDRYQLGAQVAGAVACGWIAEWAGAKAAGDDARVQRAVTALASSRDWAVLRQMDAEGDYPEVVWQYADAVAGNGTVMGGKRLTVEESYKAALCG
jgi:hypothetical protein